MTRTLLIAVAAFTLPASAALAQAAAPAATGALAGRSPVQAYRAPAANPTCGQTMHSLPAGKLPTYGTHALPAAPCDQRVEVASAEAKPRTARD